MGFISLLFNIPTKAKCSDNEIELSVRIVDPGKESRPISRAPIGKPSLFIDGNLLQINGAYDGDIIRFVDEKGYIQYSTFLGSNSNKIPLPRYLVGTFEIQLIRGCFCFYGYIEL